MCFQKLAPILLDTTDSKKLFTDYRTIVLKFTTPVWLDDIICVTNGTTEDHERKLREILPKLEDAGYRTGEKEIEFFKRRLSWLGYHINYNYVKTMTDKTEAITKLQVP